MKIIDSRLAGTSLIIAVMLLAGTAPAQVPNTIELTANCENGQINVHVDMNIGGVLPTEWIGWIVVREDLGECSADQAITGLLPFPAGEISYDFYDSPGSVDLHHKYRAFALDAQAVHYSFNTPDFPPAYYSFDYATCGEGPAVEGELIDLGWTLGIDICPNECWPRIAFLSGYDAELESHLGTGETLALYGRIDADFEGPYLNVDSWRVIPDCGPVANTPTSWGAVKGRYF